MISISINMDEVDQARIFPGKKGNYLNMVLIERNDQYGNNYMVVQQVSKEERENGIKGNILGNGKNIIKQDPMNHNNPPDEIVDNSGYHDPLS